MGVTGLHQQLKDIQTKTSLSNYKGKTLAVDTYGWLHKAIVSCAQELCLNQPTSKYISSVTKKIDMLRYFGVEPYLVFDGASLPTKAQTAAERRMRREEAQKKADQLIKSGNRKLAWKEFMKAAAVTCNMAKSVMIELDRLNVKYVVAPYEADPQMVYLEKIGEVDGILSEDSDLLIFGCNKLITKLNDFGECIEINRADFDKVKSINGLELFTPEQLRLVAMLSGCDYTKGIPGVGLKTAFNLVKKYNNLERVLMALRAEGKKTPDDFEDEVMKADLAFQYQKVFNPKALRLETLNEYPKDFSFDMEVVEQCCGLTLTQSVHIGISNGSLNPNTHEALISREQNIHQLKSKSFTYKPEVKSKSNTIDLFFNKRSGPVSSATVSSVSSAVSSGPKVSSVSSTETEKSSRLELEKLSPIHKRTKKTISLPEETPKLSGKLSKFFTNRNSPNETFPTPPSAGDEDVTGDSEISEASSPFAHTKKPQKPVNVLDDLTDDDEDHSPSHQTKDSLVKSKSSSKETVKRLSGDFDLEEEDIEESPVKVKTDTTHFLEDRGDLKKLLRDTFLFDPTSTKKYTPLDGLLSGLKGGLREGLKGDSELRPPLAPKLGLVDSDTSSLSSTSSVDLNADDLGKENSLKPVRTSSLSKFAFTG